jgi:hypothetical protein
LLILPPLGLKLSVFIYGLRRHRWRNFGIGVLVSIALAPLVYVGMCFMEPSPLKGL